MMMYIPGPYLSEFHKFTGSVLMFACYFSFYKASTTDPGFIDLKDKSHSNNLIKKYQFDGVMFQNDWKECHTCNIVKPARSKHCFLCERCVERMDHHCVWINNCVGVNNHIWFLAFLFLHVCICFYGAYAGTAIILGEIQNSNEANQDHFRDLFAQPSFRGINYRKIRPLLQPFINIKCFF